jgi:hypothetical protein
LKGWTEGIFSAGFNGNAGGADKIAAGRHETT